MHRTARLGEPARSRTRLLLVGVETSALYRSRFRLAAAAGAIKIFKQMNDVDWREHAFTGEAAYDSLQPIRERTVDIHVYKYLSLTLAQTNPLISKQPI